MDIYQKYSTNLNNKTNMFCPNNNPYTRISNTFNKLYCSTAGCSFCNYQSHQIKDILSQMENKKNEGNEVYQKIVQFYNATIKCLEMDRDRLLRLISQHTTYQYNNVQNKLTQFCRSENSSSLSQKNRKQLKKLFSMPFQSYIKEMLVGSENLFFNMLQNVRNIWIPNEQQGLSQAFSVLKEYEQNILKKQLSSTICIYKNQNEEDNRKQVITESTQLSKIKQVLFNMSEFSQKFIISLNTFAPQIECILFGNDYNFFSNSQSILKVLHNFKSLKTLKIQARRLLLNLNKTFEHVQHLQLCMYLSKIEFCNAQILQNYSQYFPSVIELILNNFGNSFSFNQKGIWDFSNFKNLKRLRIDQLDSFQSFKDIELLDNLQYLDINGNINTKKMDSFLEIFKLPKLKSLVIPVHMLQQICHIVSNIQHLKLHFRYQNTKNNLKNKDFIINNSSIKSLWMNESNIEDIDYQQIFSKLPNLQLLSNENFSPCKITNKSVEVMCKYNRQLLYLNLNYQPIGDLGAMNIGKYLTKLVYLSVKKCRIGNIGLAYLSKLRHLNSFIISTIQIKYNSQLRLNLKKSLINNKELINLRIKTDHSNHSTIEKFKIIRNQILLINQTSINNKRNHNLNKTLAYQMTNLQQIQFQTQWKINPFEVFKSRMPSYQQVTPQQHIPRVYDVAQIVQVLVQPRVQQQIVAAEYIQPKTIHSPVPVVRANYLVQKVYSTSKFSYSNQF